MGDDDELAVAVPIASSLCPQVAADIAGHTTQVHGSVGFTWEHDAPPVLQTLQWVSARPLFGHAAQWRRELAATLGV